MPEASERSISIIRTDQVHDHAAEWLEIIRRLWVAEDEFDYQGRFFNIIKGFHQPKPIQKPFPPIMNAGNSATGARFAAKYADMVFTSIAEDADDETTIRISAQRAVGREEFGREFQV
jgi:alkanesulfonate monooxygenase SsuD/methylene tetrahydromethanopterin reductase-like flavin-dependent oxidoreductase (luciferase family)